MIKIGCAAYSYRDYLEDGRMTYESFIDEAYKLRLDGVELTLYWLPSKDGDYLRKLKRHALSRGLPISCVGISTNLCNPNTLERRHIPRTLEEGIDMSHELGAPCLRIFGGRVAEGHTEAEATEWVVESLKSSVTYAETKGVVLALENHGGITATADNVTRIMESVDSPWLRVNLDLGNYRESTYEQISVTLPYAVHIHAKISVAGGATLDYHKIRDILEDGSYDGFLSIEYEENEDPRTGIPRFTKKLFSLFQ